MTRPATVVIADAKLGAQQWYKVQTLTGEVALIVGSGTTMISVAADPELVTDAAAGALMRRWAGEVAAALPPLQEMVAVDLPLEASGGAATSAEPGSIEGFAADLLRRRRGLEGERKPNGPEGNP